MRKFVRILTNPVIVVSLILLISLVFSLFRPRPAVDDQTKVALESDTVKVAKIVDGDTIKLESGETVRYIGIDTPETVDPRKPVQCFGKEASAKNKELVEGKSVRLEKDVTDKDRYGRLLRYVWLGEEMVNEKLVREGYAKSYTYPPDVKYQDKIIAVQSLAQQENKGLWGSPCNTPRTVKPH